MEAFQEVRRAYPFCLHFKRRRTFADIILFLLSYVTTTLDRAASASNPTSTTMCKALAAKLTPATS